MDPLPLHSPLFPMANTHNQEFLQSLQDESKQHKVEIQQMTYEINSTKSHLDIIDAHFIDIKGDLTYVKIKLASLTQWLKNSLDSHYLDPPSHSEGDNSSHNMNLHSNSPPRDPHIPQFEVKTFDGSDPTGWVTQMEHYFSLHGIKDELAKICYGVLCLDMK